jgi:hypothetical protein
LSRVEALELCETAAILDPGSIRGFSQLADVLETSDSEPGPSFRHVRDRLALSAVDSIREDPVTEPRPTGIAFRNRAARGTG